MMVIESLRRPGLHPVSLALEDRECIGITGPSGAGKTLLLRAIADLDENAGEVTLDGNRRSDTPAPEWRRRVAFVPAESGWWSPRVGEHFSDPARAPSLVTAVGLPADALDWPVARCSTGERQRLTLARALAQGPRVLLLDEPTSALDDENRARVEVVLQQILAAGTAIILVTHDESQDRRLAQRRFVMEAGRLSPRREA